MTSVDEFLREVVPRVYEPVLRELLTPDEFATASTRIRHATKAGRPPGGAEVGFNETFLCVTVRGEEMHQWLNEADSDDEMAARFYQDLQDWISETTFGWGQLRGEMRPL